MAISCRAQSYQQHRMDAGDIGPLVAAFVKHLAALGHTSLTVTGYEASSRQFAHWVTRSRIEVGDIDDGVIQHFARHRCRCPGIRKHHRVSAQYVNRVRRFIDFLTKRGIVRRKVTRATAATDRRVVEFQDWLRQRRGICERTIDRYGRTVMRLLPALGSRPRNWNAPLIREVILAETKRASIAYVKTMTMALRGYLRFLGAVSSMRWRSGF